MRIFLRILVFLCMAYFVVGWAAVQGGWLDNGLYTGYAPLAGIAGALLALLSIALPPVTAADLRSQEIDTLKNIYAAIQKMEQGEDKNSGPAQTDLQKAEIATLIRKISLSLFLQDQAEQLQTKIVEQIQANQELHKLLNDFRTVKQKLTALEEEINLNTYIDLVLQILEAEQLRDRYAALKTDERILVTGYNLILRNIGIIAPGVMSRLFR